MPELRNYYWHKDYINEAQIVIDDNNALTNFELIDHSSDPQNTYLVWGADNSNQKLKNVTMKVTHGV